MARGKKKEKELTPEEKLQQALMPVEEQPYEVPDNWCWTSLIAACKDFIVPQRDKPKAFDGDVPWCRIEDIEGKYLNCSLSNQNVSKKTIDIMNLRVCPVGTVICSCSASLGVQAILTTECCTNQTFIGLVCASILNNNYLYYYLRSLDQYWAQIGTGTTIKYISRKKFEQLKLPLPPLPEQQRIVERIESLFAKLDEAKEKAQAVVDGFEDRKAAILHKAFTGELIGLSNHNTVPLKSIADSIRIGPFGSALHKKDYIVGGIPVVNPKHIVNQQVVLDERTTVSKEKAEELCSYKLKKGDIVMGRRGEMGRSAPVTEEQDGWLCGTGSLIIRLQEGYDASFYSQIIASHSSIQYLEENCVGSTMNNLNEKIVKGMPVPNYSKEVQQQIVNILKNLFEKEQQVKEASEQVIDQIDLMKQSILARAFRGELGTNDPTDESAEELLKRKK